MPTETAIPDYHTHVGLCRHASGTASDLARCATAAGFGEIAVTDHAPSPDGYDPQHRMDFADFAGYEQSVRDAQDLGGCRVLLGIEADLYDGGPEFLRGWLPSRPFDLVLGSVHYLDFWNLASSAQASLWDSADVHSVWRRYFELVGRLADTRLYDVVTHFDLPKKSGFRPDAAIQREMVLPVLERIAAAGMAVEINTSGWHHTVNEAYPSPLILGWMRQFDIPITFGSDAHRPERVGSDFDRALRMAKDAGYARRAAFSRRARTLVPLPE